jgi:hypothetical protein
MPFKVYLDHKLKLTHGAPKTRSLQLINKKNLCLFSFHLGIYILIKTEDIAIALSCDMFGNAFCSTHIISIGICHQFICTYQIFAMCQ